MPPSNRFIETANIVKGILGEENVSRLESLRRQMRDYWEGREHQGYFTLHDSSHSAGVECALYKLIPLQDAKVPSDRINPEGWFYLIAAAWLHDVGMLPKILKNDPIGGETLKDFEEARKNHNIRSREYINENYRLLGLTEIERDNLGVMCEYHRRSTDINKCPRRYNLDLQLLAAYLRLADGIHINYERVDDSLLGIFDLIGMPEKSRFHWIKCKLTHDVIPDPNTLTISIELKFSKDDMEDSVLVSNSIRDEIENELHSVRDILIRGGITYYLDVHVSPSPIPADTNIKTLLQQMINNIQLDTWASASDIFNSIISSVVYLNTLDDKIKAIETLRKYQDSIIKSNVKIRTCHVMLDKILNIITVSLDAAKSIESKKVLENLKDVLLAIKAERDAAVKKIAENTKPILSDGESILLFGHSKIVIAALAFLDEDVKRHIEIYVCEGRNSGRYSYLNEIEYCDGLEYARAIMEKGFTNVSIVPDILVGNLLGRTNNFIKKIIFGANGIDVYKASFGHTAGHLAIAKLAKLYAIPVYVLADCFKFGELKYNENVERDNKWLMGEGSTNHPRLEGIRLFNPREDEVKEENITYLITEFGMFPPNHMPTIIKAKYSQYLDSLVRLHNKS